MDKSHQNEVEQFDKALREYLSIQSVLCERAVEIIKTIWETVGVRGGFERKFDIDTLFEAVEIFGSDWIYYVPVCSPEAVHEARLKLRDFVRQEFKFPTYFFHLTNLEIVREVRRLMAEQKAREVAAVAEKARETERIKLRRIELLAMLSDDDRKILGVK